MANERKPPEGQTSTAEDALLAARRAKAEAVRARGENPFANDLAGPPAPLAELRDWFSPARRADGKYDPEKVRDLVAAHANCRPAPGAPPLIDGAGGAQVAGRIIFMRDLGQVRFLRL